MVQNFDIGPNHGELFNEKIKEFPSAFIRIHMPGCGHCVMRPGCQA